MPFVLPPYRPIKHPKGEGRQGASNEPFITPHARKLLGLIGKNAEQAKAEIRKKWRNL